MEVTEATDEDGLRREIAELDEAEKELAAEAANEQRKYDALKAEADAVEAQIAEYAAVLAGADRSTVDALRTLLEERDEAKRAESAFKRDCRRQVEELDAQIERLRDGESGENFGAEDIESAELAEHEELSTRLDALMGELARLNREVFRLEREVERRPSQIELNQYQRRFVELYNQMASKHRETKRYYVLHNTLVDVLNFVKREIDLLNNIDDSKHLALRDGYKDSFVENLQGICRSVEQSLDKILCGKRTLQEQRDALADSLQLLVDKQRLYMKTVVEFQNECQKNEQLREALEAKQLQS